MTKVVCLFARVFIVRVLVNHGTRHLHYTLSLPGSTFQFHRQEMVMTLNKNAACSLPSSAGWFVVP